MTSTSVCGSMRPSGVGSVTSSAVQVCQVGGDGLAVLGMHAVEGNHLLVALRGTHAEQHGFDARAAAVVEAGVRDIHARQLANQRLVLEHGLQIALADFRLVGSVGRVEFAPRGQRVDHGRDEMVVAAAAQEAQLAGRVGILPRQLLHVLGQLQFRQRRRQVQVPPPTEFNRNALKQFVQRLSADRFQHGLLVLGRVEQIGHGVSVALVKLRWSW